jgi:hypothetical protein
VQIALREVAQKGVLTSNIHDQPTKRLSDLAKEDASYGVSFNNQVLT